MNKSLIKKCAILIVIVGIICAICILVINGHEDVKITGGELAYSPGIMTQGANAYYAMIYGDDYVAYEASINATGLSSFKTYTLSGHWYDSKGQQITSNSREISSDEINGGKLIDVGIKGRDPGIEPASYAIVKILDGDKVLQEYKVKNYDGSKDTTWQDFENSIDP